MASRGPTSYSLRVKITASFVLLVLGGMHFFNMFNFDKMRRKGARPDATAVIGPSALTKA